MTVKEFKERLSDLGWSQATFSKKTGMSQNTVSRWISGEISQIPEWVDAYLKLAGSIQSAARLIQK